MKTILCFITVLLTLATLVFVPKSFAQTTAPHNMVRLIYFVPRGRTPQPDIDVRLDKLIKDVQTFFADEMERHGFGRKTFRIETDRNGKALVHHVRGKFNDAYYQINTTHKVHEDTKERFDRSKNIYLFAIDISTEVIGVGAKGVSCGQGHDNAGGGGGYAIFSASGRCFVGDFAHRLVAHELGHAFGLSHYFRNDAYIMSYGGYQNELSSCHAEWLNAHRYFNSGQTPTNNTETAIKMISSGASPPNAIRLRFEITDPDGLHQVLLLAEVTDEDPGYPSVLDCKSLSGENNIIEFVRSELAEGPATEVWLHVIDGYGYITRERIEINIASLLPRGKVVSIPDANLAAAIRETLGLRPRSAITQRDMLRLTRLEASKRQITNLTGLEHAVNLRYLDIWDNQIRDITPLTGLIRLKRIYIWSNQISSIPTLSGLADLTDLSISGNSINDITPIAGLTQLKSLLLIGNGITDITPIAGLTQLKSLLLTGNGITDITLIAGLTQLKSLLLTGNGITDITPIAGLTKLQSLDLVRNQVSDLNALASLTQLEFLYLSNNHISDVRPITGLVSLRSLGLQNNPILNVSVLNSLLKMNPDLKLDIDIPETTPVVQAVIRIPHPMYWIDTERGTLHRTIDGGVEDLVPSVRNATSFAVDAVGEKLYWTEKTGKRAGKIQRANLDGTDVELIKKLTSIPLNIAVDAIGGTVYLTNSRGRVQRLNVDGTDFKSNLISGLDSPTDIALDVSGGKVYWTENAGSIQRANLDGSEVETVASDLGTQAGIVVSGGKVYWTEQTSENMGKIQRANDNGENVETLVTIAGMPHGLAVDAIARQLYWTNASGGIQRADLDGNNLQNLVTELDAPGDFALHIRVARVLIAASQRPSMYWTDTETNGFYRLVGGKKIVESFALDRQNITGLAVDVSGGKVYWTEQTSRVKGEIRCANLDGSNVQVIRAIRRVPRGLALDVAGRKIYYTNSNGKIQRVNFNGSNLKGNLIRGLDAPEHIALDVGGGKVYWTEAGESIRRANLNGSNVEMLVSDLGTVGDIVIAEGKLYWTEQTGKNSGKIQRSDLDGNNVRTLATLRSVPLGLGVDTTGKKLYWTNAGGKIQRANLNGKRVQTVVSDLGTPMGLVLGTGSAEAMVASAPNMVFPDETALLSNYPNPFNPETWIPYQLSTPAEVTITIYAINGQLIRTLALGHQPAGMYQNRNRAAYWNGKNQVGEPVASGVYFYTFTASKFTATRKMVILK